MSVSAITDTSRQQASIQTAWRSTTAQTVMVGVNNCVISLDHHKARAAVMQTTHLMMIRKAVQQSTIAFLVIMAIALKYARTLAPVSVRAPAILATILGRMPNRVLLTCAP